MKWFNKYLGCEPTVYPIPLDMFKYVFWPHVFGVFLAKNCPKIAYY